MSPSNRRAGLGAFSLLELLVAMAIFAVIAVFAAPAVTSLLRGSKIQEGAQIITSQLSMARQQALTHSRAVEVRFLCYGDPEHPGESPGDPSSWRFQAVHLLEIDDAGTAVPLGKTVRLPEGLVLDDAKYSSLISESAQGVQTPGKDHPDLPRGIGRRYRYSSFRFHPDGSTDLSPTRRWYVTLVAAHDRTGDQLPPNYVTIQIDPLGGTLRTFRPTGG